MFLENTIMWEQQGKRKMLYVIVAAAVLIGIWLITFLIPSRTPIKYAVHMESINEYPGSILVKVIRTTGPGWERVGDEYGLYTNSRGVNNVQLEGYAPPSMSFEGSLNVYLCILDPTKTYVTYFEDYGFEYEVYSVLDWYPIYPVRRHTIFMSEWIHSKDYLSKYDLRNYLSK
jgi:hypothetical protein